MQFVIIAKDATDAEALSRRMQARDGHLAHIRDGLETGEQIMAAAMLDQDEKMCGSVMFVEFENREKLDEWLAEEPFVTEKVWGDIQVIPCRIPDIFSKA